MRLQLARASPAAEKRATPITRRSGAARLAMRASVGPILPPTPSTMMSPGARSRSATSAVEGRLITSSSSWTSANRSGRFIQAPVRADDCNQLANSLQCGQPVIRNGFLAQRMRRRPKLQKIRKTPHNGPHEDRFADRRTHRRRRQCARRRHGPGCAARGRPVRSAARPRARRDRSWQPGRPADAMDRSPRAACATSTRSWPGTARSSSAWPPCWPPARRRCSWAATIAWPSARSAPWRAIAATRASICA